MSVQAQVRRIPDWKPISLLLFDTENYRLPEDGHGASQSELLQILDRDFELSVIGESLADNGYFAEEPLIGIPGSAGRYIVVEGNRRLAALKLLVQPELRHLSLNPDYWEGLVGRLRYDISEVPVLVYQDREELTTLLGFRHIAGILKWDPLAKARFIGSLVERKGEGADFAEVARETGSRKPTIRDNYIAFRILLQATDAFEIDTSKLEKNFSVFYRALSNPSFTEFIGLNKDRSPKDLRTPIPAKKAAALEELIGYIHGTSKIDAVLTDSRQLTKLGEILSSKDAYNHLRVNRNLDQAYQLTGGEERRLIDNLNRASFYLDDALRDTHRYKASTRVTRLVKRCAETMSEILRSFPEVQRELEGRH